MTNINISNISEGDKFKNYKELCAALGEDVLNGKSKVLQIAEFQRYFSYEKIGREFVINEIYSNPIEKPDPKKGGNIIYLEHLEIVLLDYLVKCRYSDTTNLIELTMKDIAVITGMCKRDYITKTFEELQRENPEITRYDHNELRRRFETKMHKTIEQMFKSLAKDFVLYSRYGYKIKKKIDDNFYWVVADDDDANIIRDVKNKALRFLKKDPDDLDEKISFRTIVMRYQVEKFYEIVNEILYKQYGWVQIYKTHFIGFGENLEKDIESRIKTNSELRSNRLSLNTKIINYMDENALDIYDKHNKQYDKDMEACFGDQEKIKKLFKIKDKYVENQMILSNVLLKIK